MALVFFFSCLINFFSKRLLHFGANYHLLSNRGTSNHNSFSKSLSVKYVSSTGDTTVNKTDKNDYPYDIGVPVTSCSGHIIFPDGDDGGDDNYSR